MRGRTGKVIDDASMKTLINSIRPRQHLWNPEDDGYRDKCKAARAWRDISKTLQIPEYLARSKWKNLRDIFKRELRKYSVTNLEDYKGHWRYFESLWFLFKPGEYMYATDDLQVEDRDTYTIKVLPHEDEDEDEENKVYADALDTSSEKLNDDDFEEETEAPAKKMKESGDDDYDMMFLKSLAPYFRALCPVKKLVVRNKIQEILLDELGAQT